MSKDGYLPPGATDHDIREHYDAPVRLRCIGCGRDFPAEELDEWELCEGCREEEIEAEAE